MKVQSPKQAGFTLIEMMVALAIFALISVAGVALLQSASSTQLAVKGRLDELGRNARSVALLEADLAQAVARPVRSGNALLPAFAAQGSEATGQLFAVTRTGQANLDDRMQPSVQRIIYALEGNRLMRLASASPDSGAGEPAVLLTDVASANLRFRDGGGNWRSDWAAEDARLLPRAVELVIDRNRGAPVTFLFLVGTGQAVAPAKPQSGGDNAPPA